MFTRRQLLGRSSLLALAPTVPLFVSRTAGASPADPDRRVLVVLEMQGGNDALNTVVPFTDPVYEKLRPRLKIAPREVQRLTPDLGLHPSLKALAPAFQAGHLAVVTGVGYPAPSRSHFVSRDVWHTARSDPEDRKGYGWLGRALDPTGAASYVIGTAVPGALRGRRSAAVALTRGGDLLLADPGAWPDLDPPEGDALLAFVRRQAVDARRATEELRTFAERDPARYPDTKLAERLKLVARLIKAGSGTRVFYTAQDGYDTHAGQAPAHAGLLLEFAGAVAAFFDDLAGSKLADRVTLLAFSEFGRTIRENASFGTDHGTAGVVFVAGPGVKGGVAGRSPSLTDLDEGEPKMATDFRCVYASVLEEWLGLASRAVLGAEFARLALFRERPRGADARR